MYYYCAQRYIVHEYMFGIMLTLAYSVVHAYMIYLFAYYIFLNMNWLRFRICVVRAYKIVCVCVCVRVYWLRNEYIKPGQFVWVTDMDFWQLYDPFSFSIRFFPSIYVYCGLLYWVYMYSIYDCEYCLLLPSYTQHTYARSAYKHTIIICSVTRAKKFK